MARRSPSSRSHDEAGVGLRCAEDSQARRCFLQTAPMAVRAAAEASQAGVGQAAGVLFTGLLSANLVSPVHKWTGV